MAKWWPFWAECELHKWKRRKKEATSYLSWLFTSIFPSFSVPEHTLIDYVPFLATIFLTLTLTHIAYIDKFLHKTLPANDFHGWNDIKISPLICVFNLNIGKIAASNEFIAYRDTERESEKKFFKWNFMQIVSLSTRMRRRATRKIKIIKIAHNVTGIISHSAMLSYFIQPWTLSN
jgi:hypothetical protein